MTAITVHMRFSASAKALAVEGGVELLFTNDPKVAVSTANVIVTDTWISMGQEEEAKQRKIDFAGYQVRNQTINFKLSRCIF